MYPVFRVAWALWKVRKRPSIGLWERHEIVTYVYPWDLDIFMELNNGRTLTLYDIPRIALSVRTGLYQAIKAKNYRMTIAGASVRYRKRLTAFSRIRVSAQFVGADERFFYILQNMYHGSDPAGQAVFRVAFAKNGIVSTEEVCSAIGAQAIKEELPEWIRAWADSENKRPWPPQEE